MNEYAKGPWVYDKNLTIWDADGEEVADVVNVHKQYDMCECRARLIAAAPDLLEACETFLEWSRREKEGFYDSEHSRDPQTGLRYPEGSEEYRDAFWKWYDDNVDLCDLAKRQAEIAIDKAKGEEK